MQKLERAKIVKMLKNKQLKNIYDNAIIENIAVDYIEEYNLPNGTFDNTVSSK